MMAASTPGQSRTDPVAGDRMVAFGLVVAYHRTRAGISQQRLGELAGVDRQTVNRIENGAYATNILTMWRLADALDVPLDKLTCQAQDVAAEPGRAQALRRQIGRTRTGAAAPPAPPSEDERTRTA
jgi:putative transcriptional regulator